MSNDENCPQLSVRISSPFPLSLSLHSFLSGRLPLPLKCGPDIIPGKMFEILHCCSIVLANVEIRKTDFLSTVSS